MISQKDKTREDFEAWARKELGFTDYSLEISESGYDPKPYAALNTQWLWIGYQARNAEIQELKDMLGAITNLSLVDEVSGYASYAEQSDELKAILKQIDQVLLQVNENKERNGTIS